MTTGGLAGKWFLILATTTDKGTYLVPHGMHDNGIEAQQAVPEGWLTTVPDWHEHPRGGFITPTAYGTAWCAPVEVLGLIEDLP